MKFATVYSINRLPETHATLDSAIAQLEDIRDKVNHIAGLLPVRLDRSQWALRDVESNLIVYQVTATTTITV